MELPGGSVLANIRPDSGAVSPRGARVTAASTDGGETFSAPRPDPALINGHCQASMLRAKENASCPRCGDRVLFANPATAAGRCNGTLRISTDGAKTWAAEVPLGRSAGEAFAYSCLTHLPGDGGSDGPAPLGACKFP